MVTAVTDGDAALGALAAGANGYLIKPFQVDECLQSIRLVLAGGNAFCTQVLAGLFPELSASGGRQATRPVLGLKDQELLPLLERGLRYKEIPDVLRISLRSTRRRIARLYKKLSATNRDEALNNWRQAAES